MAAENPKEELPPPRTEDEWLDALHQFAIAIRKGRRYTSVKTREHVSAAVSALMDQQLYYRGYVTASADLTDIYVDVQLSAAAGLMERLERDRTSAIKEISIVPIPDQRLMEIIIRVHPRPKP